jgi:GTP1/Obg family GTP-binding protein
MRDFDKRLEKAIERGQRAGNLRAEAEAQKELSERELRRRHTDYRLKLSEHIESCLRQIPDHLPGFRFDSIVSERGWGAAASRDDVELRRGQKPVSHFSRLEMLIRPLAESYVLELSAKATVRNRERFRRTHYQRLADVDLESFTGLIDLWVLEFAELYAAKS